MFRAIDVDKPRILDAVIHSVKLSPKLGSCVRELHLDLETGSKESWLLSLSQCFAHLGTLRGMSLGGMKWSELHADTRRIILRVLSQISILSLQDCSFPRTQSLIDIMLACQNLTTFAVRNSVLLQAGHVGSHETLSRQASQTPSLPSLRHIEFGGDMRLASILYDALFGPTKLSHIPKTICLWGTMKENKAPITLHHHLRIFPEIFLHQTPDIQPICSGGCRVDRLWFVSFRVPMTICKAPTGFKEWLNDILSVIHQSNFLLSSEFDDRWGAELTTVVFRPEVRPDPLGTGDTLQVRARGKFAK
ncbi:hypothetical protein PUNSTDRAFT_136173 [Punctularia strigosozonata HHB-11173 SS5]|uniref:uncharacterized protein n=1 Tax=Punctularia strigosozonata (strain HHB-11173) TaxID=741275 RepID=UPI0004416261|nr:uncharacterized protein PUNSTDRAFT_136173 [Punctularia strigosozonata HHB-11173 SS5]EIN07492.1 hypothetical protein PUNSTDRAFT_136173 [Punctularia strigosozonata HHB-11173 SS5]